MRGSVPLDEVWLPLDWVPDELVPDDVLVVVVDPWLLEVDDEPVVAPLEVGAPDEDGLLWEGPE